MRLSSRIVGALCVGAATIVSTPGVGLAKPAPFHRIDTVNATESQAVGMARTANGALQLVYQTFAGRAFDGLAATTISASGAIGPQVQALSGWQAGQPGLVSLPNGALEAVFGAVPSGLSAGVWGIVSTDGGTTWSAPVLVGGGGPGESLAYGSDITAALSGAMPVLTLPQAGNLIFQRGLGLGSTSFQLTSPSDGATTDADLATDAATGAVVAAWPSIAGNPSRDYLQGAVPGIGALQAVPGQYHNAVVIAGRDTGPGVFAAYSADGTHVRLLRYGGGSVAVGMRHGTTAKRLGVATGPAGRLWVMWGDDSGGGIAVTRSNKAVTRFEPIQHVDPKAFGLARIFGDGRLGPLDLLVDEIPVFKGSAPPAGLYYDRVHPVLSAAEKVTKITSKAGKLLGFTVKVTVSDAGDPVQGATVSVAGKHGTTAKTGMVTLSLPASAAGPATVTVTAPTYALLTVSLRL
jgi:hypothetical protein